MLQRAGEVPVKGWLYRGGCGIGVVCKRVSVECTDAGGECSIICVCKKFLLFHIINVHVYPGIERFSTYSFNYSCKAVFSSNKAGNLLLLFVLFMFFSSF